MTWKLTAGRLMSAWRAYPAQRRRIATMSPGPPIFVTGTHRSGTTWIARMLAVPGVWYVHEPFNPNKGMWQESFTYASPDRDAPAVDAMMRNLLGGRHRRTLNLPHADHPLMPLRWGLLRPRRILLKDPLACLLTGYLATHFNLQTLVVFRHPCGFVSSVTRLGWPTAEYLREFLARPVLLDDHLAPFVSLLEQHCDRDTLESAAVLHGALNRVLWNQTSSLGLRWCRFEDLCESPLDRFADLLAWCGLPCDDETRRLHEELCLAEARPVGAYHVHSVQRNSRASADSWRQQLSPREIDRVLEVWSAFDIPLYDDCRDSRVLARHE